MLSQLPGETWTVFHDLHWPGRRFANVDHVVVGPPGVFVIDSKNWSGSVTVKDEVLRCNGYSEEREVVSAAESALAIAQLTPLLRPDVSKPVLRFVRDEPLTGWARDVMITSTSTLVEMLKSRPTVLSADDVRHLSLDLEASIRSAKAAKADATPAAPARRPTPSPRPQRKRGGAGIVPSLAVAVACLVFVGSPGLRAGATDWLTGVFISNVAEDSSPEQVEQDRKGGSSGASSGRSVQPRAS